VTAGAPWTDPLSHTTTFGYDPTAKVTIRLTDGAGEVRDLVVDKAVGVGNEGRDEDGPADESRSWFTTGREIRIPVAFFA
jgi:hypothetical protein